MTVTSTVGTVMVPVSLMARRSVFVVDLWSSRVVVIGIVAGIARRGGLSMGIDELSVELRRFGAVASTVGSHFLADQDSGGRSAIQGVHRRTRSPHGNDQAPEELHGE